MILASQSAPPRREVAVGADDPDVLSGDPDHGGVECAAAEVVNEEVPRPRARRAPGRRARRPPARRGHRARSVRRSARLCGWPPVPAPRSTPDGDDHIPDLFAGLLLRGARQLAQDERGDRLRRVGLPVEGVVHVRAHVALDHSTTRSGTSRAESLACLPTTTFPVIRNRRPKASCLLPARSSGSLVGQCCCIGDAGVGRAEVDSVGSHLTSRPHHEAVRPSASGA